MSCSYHPFYHFCHFHYLSYHIYYLFYHSYYLFYHSCHFHHLFHTTIRSIIFAIFTIHSIIFTIRSMILTIRSIILAISTICSIILACYEYFVPEDSDSLAESPDSTLSIKEALCTLDSRQSLLITMN